MARKKIYSEKKRRLSLTLTDTAIKWLESRQTQLTASSLSDAIERMARELPKTSTDG
jgi:acyl-homoserine lactone acylase PvdQ